MTARDIDFECWFCGGPFRRAHVDAESLLVPRRQSEGGPYWLYRCSTCDRQSRIERNRAGVYLAGPIPIVPVADALFATFDADLRRDLTHKREHAKRRRGRREWFFGEYEEELLAQGVRFKRGRPRPVDEEPEPGPFDDDPDAEEPPKPEPKAKRKRPAPPPAPTPEPEATPWELLGLEPGADRDAIQAAFRDLAKRYHPDRFEALDEEFKALAHTKFVALKAAMDELLDGA